MIIHPELPWDWKYASRKPTLSVKNVFEHPELDWDFHQLSFNTFGKSYNIPPMKFNIMVKERIQTYKEELIAKT